ncbi:hypothetical protein [Paraburkholderia adhaesiva]|uniref:hypothetical protein n=1 Tax=Paraburkholderia adhaesiva TaxID=2883244 RepID=UPI001F44682B|nr:hypothetical protein [Paraburkholderia adhaesiva]
MSRPRRPVPLPDEPFEVLRARLWRFAQATRDEARQVATVPFPEHVSVLAGPLWRSRGERQDGRSHQSEKFTSAGVPVEDD